MQLSHEQTSSLVLQHLANMSHDRDGGMLGVVYLVRVSATGQDVEQVG